MRRLLELGKLLRDLVHLFRGLLRDDRVPRRAKAILLAALGYLVSPIDLIPDVIPLIGHLDDWVVLAIALDGLFHIVDPFVIESHWQGKMRTLYRIRRFAHWTLPFLPARIKRKFWTYGMD